MPQSQYREQSHFLCNYPYRFGRIPGHFLRRSMRTSGAILADALEIDGCCAQQRGSDF
jgi:hypothetical protein